MSEIFHVDFYAKDWLLDTQMLTLEERGVFITIVSSIYHRGEAILDDNKWLSNLCNCSVRKLKSIKNDLLAKGFISVKDGKIHQKRAEKEIENAQKRRKTAQENGAKKHGKDGKTGRKPDENELKITRKSVESSLKTSRKLAENEALLNKIRGLTSASHQTPVTNIKDIDKSISKKFVLPECIEPDVWGEWKKHRREIKKTLTKSTAEKQIKQLQKWYRSGHDPTEIINTSIMNGWTGLFEPKSKESTKGNGIKNQIREIAENGW
tara:strand:- start:424 stop:1218 length:795 start_codon:yes stop_codon:yes gene_type:complete